MIKIVTILGSVRPGSYSSKALALVHDELGNRTDVEYINIDPSKLHLTMPGIENGSEDAKWMNEQLNDADGILIVTPEYHGTFSSAIKLVIDNFTFPALIKEKPVSLLGVAAGQIGAIKSLEHLRSVCSHMGGIVMPGPVSVANVNSVFDEDGNCKDEQIEKRIRSLSSNLIKYITKHICPEVALEQMVRSN